MIISDKYKLLFVHIPRTSGQSVRNVITEHDPDWKEIHYFHAPITPEISEKYKDYFKFAIVRNPWQATASLYFQEVKVKGSKYDNFKHWFGIKKRQNFPNHEIFPRQLPFIFTDKLLVDNVFRYENIGQEINKLFRPLKINVDYTKVTSHNTSDKYNWRDIYKDKSNIELVRNYCQEDIEYFGWKYETD